MVSNSASVALAPLLAIWSTRAFQPGASRLCWAAISGEWHWAQTRTITSRPGPSGSSLKSSARTGPVTASRASADARTSFTASLLLLRQCEGNDFIAFQFGANKAAACRGDGHELPAVRTLVTDRCGFGRCVQGRGPEIPAGGGLKGAEPAVIGGADKGDAGGGDRG